MRPLHPMPRKCQRPFFAFQKLAYHLMLKGYTPLPITKKANHLNKRPKGFGYKKPFYKHKATIKEIAPSRYPKRDKHSLTLNPLQTHMYLKANGEYHWQNNHKNTKSNKFGNQLWDHSRNHQTNNLHNSFPQLSKRPHMPMREYKSIRLLSLLFIKALHHLSHLPTFLFMKGLAFYK